MLLWLILLIIAMGLLIKASGSTVRYAVGLAKITGISEMAIGFVIISVSTSLPEMAIALVSSIQGEAMLSVGNLIGASIANITLIIGSLALIGFSIAKKDLDGIQQLLAFTGIIAFSLLVLGESNFIFGIFIMILFYMFSLSVMRKGVKIGYTEKGSKTKMILYLIGSCLLVVISSLVVTDSALKITQEIGISESILGATILAIGTTLPELSIGMAALMKKNTSLAVSEITGSLIVNMAFIFGLVSIIQPITLGLMMRFSLATLLFSSVVFAIMSKARKFGKNEALLLISIYSAYIIIMIEFGVMLK